MTFCEKCGNENPLRMTKLEHRREMILWSCIECLHEWTERLNVPKEDIIPKKLL